MPITIFERVSGALNPAVAPAIVRASGEAREGPRVAAVLRDPPVPSPDLPNLVPDALRPIDPDDYARPDDPRHAPRILIVYGSLHERSFSRLLSEEADRILRVLGCETRTFSPHGLPLPDAPQTSARVDQRSI